MEISEIYKLLEDKLDKIVTDTRQIKKGDIFFALKGPNFNGNEFALQALENGASYVIVDQFFKPEVKNMILVPDVLTCLQNLARIHRQNLNIPSIGITGSNGKTTTKELLFSILSLWKNTLATVGNFNNHIGVPLTILKLKSTHEWMIIELGANAPGNIEELCSIADPDFALITSLGKSHLEGFGSFEKLIETKMELFEFVEKKSGKLFFNLNDPNIQKWYKPSDNHIGFGDDTTESKYQFKLLESHPKIKLQQIQPVEEIFETELFGEHNYQNVIAAITISQSIGVPISLIRQGLKNYIPSNMRSQILEWRNNKVILDAYNANPASMKSALVSLSQFDTSPKLAILGKMAELGEFSNEEHQKILEFSLNLAIDKILCVGGEWPVIEHQKLIYKSTVDEAKLYLNNIQSEGQTILIKGSRSAALENLLKE
ncbi:MAG: UDP-N-acetylmuramoyl-tripeptide--D-alanyl-D-alanine ligase [Saprospiraceae bacterium]|nr:UDP-N-acetylmuramoyl-tripeptide--D-alanyl-D-alanine ligase [Saprospiraceae bacterium]